MRYLMVLFNIFFLLLSSTTAFSDEQFKVYDSARALGRGDTNVAAFDSDEAAFFNPATLSEAKSITWQLRFFQLDAFVGENLIDTVDDIMDMKEGSTLGVLETLAEKFGQRQYAKVQYIPFALRIKSFEISPFFTSSNFAEARSPVAPDMEFRSDTIAGMNLSLGLEATKGMHFGVTVRPMHRTLFQGKMDIGDVINLLAESEAELGDVFQEKQATYVGLNLGWVWNASKELRFGATADNIGFASNQGEFDNAADPLSQRISLGMNYRIDLKPWHWDFALDLQDVVNPENYNYLRLIHMGTEIGTSYLSRDNDAGFLLGINEGYLTTGAYADVFLGRLGLTYYAVELGEYPGQRKDRRYALTIQTAMTF